MLPYPRINPNIIEIGPIKLRWYGLMYVVGFVAAYVLIGRQQQAKKLGLQGQLLQDLIFFLALGLVIGARLGYLLFYQFHNLGDYLQHPLELVAIWHGGMSFHGGLLGAMAVGIWFCRRRQLPVWQVADRVIVTAPIGLGFGRLGNFINGELYGRPTTIPWGMVFPGGGPIPRHPSQLYEMFFEGPVLFGLLWLLKDRVLTPGAMVCTFLAGYGICRFFLEFFRQPDPQLGLFWGWLSMGQLLCGGMVLLAAVLWLVRRRAEDRSEGGGIRAPAE